MADIWSLGMFAFAMVNPSVSYPFSKEKFYPQYKSYNWLSRILYFPKKLLCYGVPRWTILLYVHLYNLCLTFIILNALL